MQRDLIKTLVNSLKQLQISGDYSDLRIFCGDQVFTVHKAVICTRSEFFHKACKWGKDGQPKHEIDLGTDDPKIVKLMIDYFYQLDYNDVLLNEFSQSRQEPGPVESSSRVTQSEEIKEETIPDETEAPSWEFPRVPWDHGLTPKGRKRREKEMRSDGTWYDRITQEMIDEQVASAEVAPLDDIVEEVTSAPEAEPVSEAVLIEVKSRLQDFDVNPLSERIVINTGLYALAEKYGVEDLKSLAKEKFSAAVAKDWRSEAFVRAAELVFNTTPASDMGLRSVVLNTFKHQDLADYEEVQNLLDSGNGIAWQLLKSHFLENAREDKSE